MRWRSIRQTGSDQFARYPRSRAPVSATLSVSTNPLAANGRGPRGGATQCRIGGRGVKNYAVLQPQTCPVHRDIGMLATFPRRGRHQDYRDPDAGDPPGLPLRSTSSAIEAMIRSANRPARRVRRVEGQHELVARSGMKSPARERARRSPTMRKTRSPAEWPSVSLIV